MADSIYMRGSLILLGGVYSRGVDVAAQWRDPGCEEHGVALGLGALVLAVLGYRGVTKDADGRRFVGGGGIPTRGAPSRRARLPRSGRASRSTRVSPLRRRLLP